MATRFFDNVKVLPAVAGTAIDTQGFNSVAIYAFDGTVVGAAAITFTDCDTVDGTFADVGAAHTLQPKDTVDVAGDNFVAAYVGGNRFIKFAHTGAGLADADFVVVLGEASDMPVVGAVAD